MKGILLETLRYPYFDRLVSRSASGFADLVIIGDNIEKGLKSGKILSNVGAPSAQIFFFGNFPKKMEGHISSIYVD